MASSLPGDLKGLECYTSKLSKVPLLSPSFSLFVYCFFWFFGYGNHLLLRRRRDGLRVERSSGSSLMSNFVKSRCLSALKMQKSFFIGTISVSNKACQGKNDGN